MSQQIKNSHFGLHTFLG